MFVFTWRSWKGAAYLVVELQPSILLLDLLFNLFSPIFLAWQEYMMFAVMLSVVKVMGSGKWAGVTWWHIRVIGSSCGEILPLQHRRQGLACVFTIHQMVFLFFLLTSFSSGHPRSCLWHSRWADTRWWGMSVHRWQTARTLESQVCRTSSTPTLQKRREVRHRRPWYYRSGGKDQTRWWTSSTENNNTIIIAYT